MAKRKSKIIIDTNLWISFLLTNHYSKLDSLFINGHVKLLFSQELLEEFIAVTQRPKLEVKENVDICRDPKDNFLLALAQASKATHLLTGDKDLLSLKIFGKTKILTLSSFLKEN
jgi:predicted nucleic acid-binding protein